MSGSWVCVVTMRSLVNFQALGLSGTAPRWQLLWFIAAHRQHMQQPDGHHDARAATNFPSGANSSDAHCECVLLQVSHAKHADYKLAGRPVERPTTCHPGAKRHPPPRWTLAARGAIFLRVGVCALIDLSARDRMLNFMCLWMCVLFACAQTQKLLCATLCEINVLCFHAGGWVNTIN